MAVTDIDVNARILPVGEHLGVPTGQDIPARCLRADNLLCVPGAQAQIFRIVSIQQAPTPTGWQTGTPHPEDVITLTSLTQTGRRTYLRRELEAIRPLGFVVLDRPWRRLDRFVEGGLYQVWPTGRVLRVRNRHLIDANTERRINADTEKDRIPPVVLWVIPRWVPPAARGAAAAAEEE